VAELFHDLLQQHGKGAELGRQGRRRLVGNEFGACGDELIGLHLALKDAKALITYHCDTEHAVGALVPVAHMHQRADVIGEGGLADLLALGD